MAVQQYVIALSGEPGIIGLASNTDGIDVSILDAMGI